MLCDTGRHGGALLADSVGTVHVRGDTVQPVHIGSGGAHKFQVGGDILPEANVSITGPVGTLEVGGDVLAEATVSGNVGLIRVSQVSADVTVDGDVAKVEIDAIDADAAVAIKGNLGPPSLPVPNTVKRLDGSLVVEGDATNLPPVQSSPRDLRA